MNLYGYALAFEPYRTYVVQMTREIIALVIAALLLLPEGVIYAALLSTNAVLNRGPVVAEGPSTEGHLLVGFIGSEIVGVIVANGVRTLILSDQDAKATAADSLAVKKGEGYP